MNALLLFANNVEKCPNAVIFLREVRRTSRVLMTLALATAVRCVTLYLSLKANDDNLQFRTNRSQYSWLVSGAYVSGLEPSF